VAHKSVLLLNITAVSIVPLKIRITRHSTGRAKSRPPVNSCVRCHGHIYGH
jgi:hypothetical protein